MKINTETLLGATAGALITAVIALLLAEKTPAPDTTVEKPLYWVAPMDPNYRRDRPGKSPMGMDLVPVYDTSDADAPGMVRISPNVVNNLGVRTAPVERRELRPEIRTVGYVQFDEDRLVHIHPRVEGWVEKLYVKATGDPVTAGQPLYALYSPQLVNAQEELLLALNRDDRRLLAAAEERLRALHLPEALIAQVKSTRRVQQTVTFAAPQDGVVAELNIREGFYVQPGTTLMAIGVLDQVWVEAEVFERQMPLIRPGLPVTMTLDYLPGESWQGLVDYLYPALDARTRTARVRLRFDNERGLLRPNMFTQVLIRGAGQGQVLAIPREAVIRTGSGDRVVLALGDGRFRSVPVRLGQLDPDYAEIREGLTAADRVVSSAQFLLDSESSRAAEAARLHHGDRPQAASTTDSPGGAEVRVAAVVEQIQTAPPRIEVSHAPVPAWNWPAMTMTFAVADGIDLSELQPGERVELTIRREEPGAYSITAVYPLDAGAAP